MCDSTKCDSTKFGSTKKYNVKSKEHNVANFLKTEFPNLNWIFDKKIHGGISRKRPDILLQLGYRTLIIEIDEHQHASYFNEKSRMDNLFNDLNNRQFICIRFNPDKYKSNNTTVKSCWEYNEQRVLIVSEHKKKEWNSRLSLLRSTITYWLNPLHVTNNDIEIIKLFYNN
jgi:hypothetical protein